MTEDEKLVEKVAEAICDAQVNRWADLSGLERVSFRVEARAAIAAVREHDAQQGIMLPECYACGYREFAQKHMVHADSTGASEPDLPPSLTVRHRHMEGGITS